MYVYVFLDWPSPWQSPDIQAYLYASSSYANALTGKNNNADNPGVTQLAKIKTWGIQNKAPTLEVTDQMNRFEFQNLGTFLTLNHLIPES